MAMSSTADGKATSPQCDEYFKKYWKLLCEDLKSKGYECPLEPLHLWEVLLQAYDTNGNGKIDPEEMIKVIERLLDWGITRGLIVQKHKKHGYPVD